MNASLSNLAFWTVAAVLAVPAIVGTFVGVALIAVIGLVGLIILIAALALMSLCCVPIIWWCALWESTKTQMWLAKIRAGIGHKPMSN
jgi:hypothetical protein